MYLDIRLFNFLEKLVRLCHVSMDGVECTVRLQAGLSLSFYSNKGLREGYVLYCLLSSVVLERAIRETGLQYCDTLTASMSGGCF